jgi:2'-5' RNA ligase
VRLFVGVELSDEMKAAAAAAAKRLQAALKRARLRVEARWVPPENLHVTLWFIGEVNDERAARISAALKMPFQVSPFTLRAGGLGAFPSSGPARIFWLGLTNGAQSLAQLHAQLATRLVPLGCEPERRQYSAHVTIARVKAVPPASSSEIRQLLAKTRAEAGSTTISAATLFRSRTSPQGATYQPLLRIRLQ